MTRKVAHADLSRFSFVKMSVHIFVLIAVATSIPVLAQQNDSTIQAREGRLEMLSLEDLMNIPITTASKTAEKLSEAPATIIVITRQDIQDRGYTELSTLR